MITSYLKLKFHQMVTRTLLSDTQRENLKKVMQDMRCNSVDLQNVRHEYTHSDLYDTKSLGSAAANPIFITSRFRSGSTLLWNLFRNVKNVTSYYEPFNERRWFDADIRGGHTDQTHLGVNDYWKEYEDMTALSSYYTEDWIRYNLLMDEQSHDPMMLNFINALIDNADGRAVLQFNRIDFRLQWLRKSFPNCKIVHLYRHPREQWYSFLKYPHDMPYKNIEENYQDHFYLDMWCRNLETYFPFLSKQVTPHPYKRFYLLWKLSYIYGKKFSDISVSFENLVSDPDNIIKELAETLSFDPADFGDYKAAITKPNLNKWESYAPDEWFLLLEQECEHTLDSFYGNRQTGKE